MISFFALGYRFRSGYVLRAVDFECAWCQEHVRMHVHCSNSPMAFKWTSHVHEGRFSTNALTGAPLVGTSELPSVYGDCMEASHTRGVDVSSTIRPALPQHAAPRSTRSPALFDRAADRRWTDRHMTRRASISPHAFAPSCFLPARHVAPHLVHAIARLLAPGPPLSVLAMRPSGLPGRHRIFKVPNMVRYTTRQ
jgi:hypothetical protein